MRFIKLIALGGIGFTVVFFGLDESLGHVSKVDRAVHALPHYDSSLASTACIPQNDEDEIFFLSCGGVF